MDKLNRHFKRGFTTEHELEPVVYEGGRMKVLGCRKPSETLEETTFIKEDIHDDDFVINLTFLQKG